MLPGPRTLMLVIPMDNFWFDPTYVIAAQAFESESG